jgi:hypothetical protein
MFIFRTVKVKKSNDNDDLGKYGDEGIEDFKESRGSICTISMIPTTGCRTTFLA